MDLHQLYYFQTLARVESFTKASEELVLSQPALSRSILRLEEEVGVPLFERKSRGVRLNRYGEVFLRHIQKAVAEIEEGIQEVNDMVSPLRGTISLSFIHTLSSSFAPELLGEFHKLIPEIKFQLSQHPTSRILEQIEKGEIDIGFCSPQRTYENISCCPIEKDELYLIVPVDHRLARRKEIDLLEAADEPFVLYKKETALREVVEVACLEAGFHPKMSFEGLDERAVAGLVGAKFGVALIPKITGIDLNKVSMIRILKPKCIRTIQMVWRTNGYMSPAVEIFKKFVEKHLPYNRR